MYFVEDKRDVKASAIEVFKYFTSFISLLQFFNFISHVQYMRP